MQEQEPKEDYILIVDADNIMRFPFDPVELKVQPGVYQGTPMQAPRLKRTVEWNECRCRAALRW